MEYSGLILSAARTYSIGLPRAWGVVGKADELLWADCFRLMVFSKHHKVHRSFVAHLYYAA